MNEHEWLTEQFETYRTHLRAVAYRMLGNFSEADDAVQESWLHLNRTHASGVENLGGWLTTVVARICLDMLRSRNSRREEPLEIHEPDLIENSEDEINPEQAALLADSLGLALLVVLDTLNPAERLAFVLHDLFAVPFDEIAPIVGRSPIAARQLASRARRRVQGAATTPDTDLTRQREVVTAFLAASRSGNFAALLALLDPDVVLRSDHTALHIGAPQELRGAPDVAKQFSGSAQAARLAQINSAIGAVWAPGGKPRLIFSFTTTHNKVVAINLLADPDHLRQLNIVILNK